MPDSRDTLRAIMFNPSQADVRRFFCGVRAKMISGAPMEAIETLASLWIEEHPEYFDELADAEAADYIVCTGLFDDETETPDDYRALLERLRARNLFMICGNPDVVVERGEQMIYCAGALADLYASMGGEVLYAGKPYAPIYDLAMGKAHAVPCQKAAPRVLAIGDSVRTDFIGAVRQGLDCLFVTAGIHSAELGGRDMPEAEAVHKIFTGTGSIPKAVTHRLAW